jgi:NIMA (never in mitosis gene a)-related kinase
MAWFVQMVQALRYVHGQRILHRDLKTANIFLTRNDLIKVTFSLTVRLWTSC